MSRSSRTQRPGLARLALLGVLGGLVRGGREVGVAQAAPAAARRPCTRWPGATRSATRSPLVAVEDDRAGRDGQVEVRARLAVAPRTRRRGRRGGALKWCLKR